MAKKKCTHINRITFDPSVTPWLLRAFKMRVRKKDQVIVQKGKPVPAIDGKPVTLKEFGGIAPGPGKTKLLIRNTLPGLIDLLDLERK